MRIESRVVLARLRAALKGQLFCWLTMIARSVKSQLLSFVTSVMW